MKLKNGRFHDGQMDLALDGIDFDVTIPDLFQAVSDPAQVIRIDTLTLGD
ncbi:MAG: hypothetical protein JRH15_10095, partial [Deltaproteobacteria bacterium]|nr:hypothetical protein [Deltaproteobacteria bacterium]